jgi:hypothetical protein
MLISSEAREESLASEFTETDGAELLGHIASLKQELQNSRAREEAATTALRILRDEVEQAYARIAQQQEKLKLLVAQVHT